MLSLISHLTLVQAYVDDIRGKTKAKPPGMYGPIPSEWVPSLEVRNLRQGIPKCPLTPSLQNELLPWRKRGTSGLILIPGFLLLSWKLADKCLLLLLPLIPKMLPPRVGIGIGL